MLSAGARGLLFREASRPGLGPCSPHSAETGDTLQEGTTAGARIRPSSPVSGVLMSGATPSVPHTPLLC
jgi:hypothetical protein